MLFFISHLLYNLLNQIDGIMTLNEKEDVAISDEGQDSPAAYTEFPDGGLKAWLVVVGGFLTYFVTFGEQRMQCTPGEVRY